MNIARRYHISLMLLLLLCMVSTACTRKPSIEERRTIERLKEELASIKQQLEEAQQEHSAYSGRVSKNAVFGLNFLPGFWTRQISWIMPILTGFGPNPRGPKSGQGKLADLDALS